MKTKQLDFGDEALRSMLRGVDVLADAVGDTLGPRGRHVVIERSAGAPLVTRDGATVAEHIELPDPLENAGTQTVREAALRTAELAGDGTTTATVLARAIVAAGIKRIAVGADPMGVKRGIDRATEAAVVALDQMARPCETPQTIERVATVSANGDVAMGHAVARAVATVGADGAVTIEAGRGREDEVEFVEGAAFAQGYLSRHFVADGQTRDCVLERPLILLQDGRLDTVTDILPVLELAAAAGRSLLVVADDVAGEALATMAANAIRGSLRCCAVKAPSFGDERREIMKDLAALTGATLVSPQLGMSLADVREEHLGSAQRVEIEAGRTVIVGGAGDADAFTARMAELRAQIEQTEPGRGREQLRERLARLAGGVAVYRVGALSEPELHERTARADDALRAVQAAMKAGFVPGGGLALLDCVPALESLDAAHPDIAAGIAIMRDALEAPLRRIAANAGDYPSVVVDKLRCATPGVGYDANSGQLVDLAERGIIDPLLVTRTALRQAASVAAAVLTATCVVTEHAVRDDTTDSTEGVMP